jgi:hypothetical protein
MIYRVTAFIVSFRHRPGRSAEKGRLAGNRPVINLVHPRNRFREIRSHILQHKQHMTGDDTFRRKVLDGRERSCGQAGHLPTACRKAVIGGEKVVFYPALHNPKIARSASLPAILNASALFWSPIHAGFPML